jgi:uncharacterized protein (DUF1778 family)
MTTFCSQNDYMASSTTARKPLGVRATPEEHEQIRLAAQREHRSVNSFVLSAALRAAENQATRPKRSREEIMAIFNAAREAVREVVPANRDILEEFLAERRAEAERE